MNDDLTRSSSPGFFYLLVTFGILLFSASVMVWTFCPPVCLDIMICPINSAVLCLSTFFAPTNVATTTKINMSPNDKQLWPVLNHKLTSLLYFCGSWPTLLATFHPLKILTAPPLENWRRPPGYSRTTVHGVHSTKSVSRVDNYDSEPRKLLHSRRGCWISGLAGYGWLKR